MAHHLAQLNVARAKAPVDDPSMAEFMNALDHVNALAEASPGYVWRLQDDAGNATAIRPFDDPTILVNLTVWESLETLKAFAYKGEHGDYFRRRAEWFESEGRGVVLWWVEAGHLPDTTEALSRLALLRANGPGPLAFTFGSVSPPPTP